MKMSKVGRLVGVDRGTILNWVNNKSMEHLFSSNARNEGSRELDEQDIFIVNTIKHLRKTDTTDWERIAKKIDDGYIITDLSIGSADVDTGKTPVQQFTRTIEIAQERNLAVKQLAELQDKLLHIEEVHKEEMNKVRQGYDTKLSEKEQRHEEKLSEKEQRYEEKLSEKEQRYEEKLSEKEQYRVDEIREAAKREGELQYRIGQLEAELKFLKPDD
jgi:hypothetical protein